MKKFSEEATHEQESPKAQKVTALTALFTFSINTLTGFTMGIVSSQGAGGLPILPGAEHASLAERAAVRAIPEQAGMIGEFFSAPVEQAVIYHVQDAHTSLEAQQNIKKILDRMTQDSKIDTIFLEGTLDEVHGDWMRFFSDEKANAKAAQLLAKQGLIGGAELFLLEHDRQNKNLRILGVEDRELYLKNLEAYRAVLSHRSESENFLRLLQSQILTAASRVFNKKLGLFLKSGLCRLKLWKTPSVILRVLRKPLRIVCISVGIIPAIK